MKSSLSRYLGISSLISLLGLASPALAQDVATAEALFNRGLADMEAGRYATGCPAIAESQRLDPRGGTLFTLSQCEVRWGRIATAVTRLGDYLELYERLTPDQKVLQGERRKVAKEQRDKLAPDVPELTLSLPPGAPAGTVVKRDGAVVGEATLGLGLPVDPGEHVVSTQAPGGALWEQQFTIAKGEKMPLVLEVKAAPTVEALRPITAPVVVATPEPAKQAARPPTTKASTSGRKMAVYAISGVGVSALGLIGGIIFSVSAGAASGAANKLTSDIRDERDKTVNDPAINPDGRASVCGDHDTGAGALPHFAKACENLRSNERAYHADVALAVTSWVLFGVGVAGTTTYAMINWYPKKEQKLAGVPRILAVTPVVSPTLQGVAFVGTF